MTKLEASNLLLNVTREVRREFEAAALIEQASKLNKAISFKKVKGSDHTMVANVLGSRDMMAMGLGLPYGRFLSEFEKRTSTQQRTKLLKNGPVQEVVVDSVESANLPIATYFERDAGPYITAGTAIARDPETGFRNSSFNRMMLKTGTKFGIRMMPPQHLGIIQSKAETKQRNLEVAVVLGNHPAEMIASASSLPYGQDHLDYASAIRGEPLETVKCKTIELEVPANAEIVIEGEVEANVREDEGPFGEFRQYYVGKGNNHVLKVKAITYRADYIYQALLCGSAEDLGILALAREVIIHRALTAAGIDVIDISLSPFLFNGAISIRKRFEGEPKNAMMAAFGSYSWLKYCIIVDEDVNVHDLADVWWALGTRSQPENSMIIRDGLGFPRADKWQIHRGKIGIDATYPRELTEEFQRKRIPGKESVNLSKYVQ